MIRKNSEYPLQPPRERGTGRAFAFALVMHALLGFFLYHGIQWQNSTPEGAEAELWTEVPDTSIPRPVPPPPAPVVAPPPPVRDEQADIALQEKKRQQQQAAREAQLAEQQRQQKLQAQQEADAKRQQQLAADQAAQLAAQKAAAAKQKQQQQQQADKLKQQQLAEQQKQQQLKEQQQEQQKQAEADAQKKADAQKAAKAKAQADAAAQAKKVDAERRARLAQMQGLATGGAGSTTSDGLGKNGTGSGSGGTATSPGYSDKVRRAVRPNISWGGETSGLETVVSVRCSPTGTLLGATISRSSGNAAWDDAALRAVQRTDPMPQDINGKTPTSFLITLRPAGAG
ncbi:cell envelope integrity protein TolA [Paraburkholderia sp. FT54]|jgi:colicin import membrane protein|uniref:cell envelope integrity protein TolA n=1 Tax=Paraburkholderia sp. FT54 TaxID=3074437 RepID=UPI0028777D60|nr:cell envelope integrity protein TolA [Paraburkholderia sp. FT54]WNC89257.1 cell envelope integrity protein TolA [Paraburkholderia sp. FT54]